MFTGATNAEVSPSIVGKGHLHFSNRTPDSIQTLLGIHEDLEDAKYIYETFKSKIDRGELEKWVKKLSIDASILEM